MGSRVAVATDFPHASCAPMTLAAALLSGLGGAVIGATAILVAQRMEHSADVELAEANALAVAIAELLGAAARVSMNSDLLRHARPRFLTLGQAWAMMSPVAESVHALVSARTRVVLASRDPGLVGLCDTLVDAVSRMPQLVSERPRPSEASWQRALDQLEGASTALQRAARARLGLPTIPTEGAQ